MHLVADQPVIVEEAVSGFTQALVRGRRHRAGGVSFVSLGMRAGFVVALSIPLVLAITFIVMAYLGISLQRISLGALIIALGLLVDDAMIAVEMMVARLEVGDTLRKAATYVYTSTAFPMLTGTLVTVAGFIPIGLNDSAAGEFTFTLFVVIAVSLLVSWIVAVLFAPLLGVTILPKTMKASITASRAASRRLFRRVLVGCVRWRWLTIVATVLLFAASIFGMRPRPAAVLPVVRPARADRRLDAAAERSIAETHAQMRTLREGALAGNPDIEHWSLLCRPGRGALRAVLRRAAGQSLFRPDRHRHQEPRGARPGASRRCRSMLREDFVGTDAFVKLLDTRPAGRAPGAVPRQRSGHPDGAQTWRSSSPASFRRNPQLGDVDLSTGTSRRACSRSMCCRTRRASSASPPRISPPR